ncbi:MAG: hypothetical protein ACO3JL_19550, partial [Myxococcota bacterium]
MAHHVAVSRSLTAFLVSHLLTACETGLMVFPCSSAEQCASGYQCVEGYCAPQNIDGGDLENEDAGPFIDAGTSTDAGTAIDAGTIDAGTNDAGTNDAGTNDA